MDASEPTQRYDLTIVLGTAIALYWSLYVQPANGEILALVLGSLPVAYGLYRYVPAEQLLVQGLAGLLAVVLGGMVPPSILVHTQAGRWLVGSTPLPVSLAIAIAVVLCTFVLRRSIRGPTSTVENSVQ